METRFIEAANRVGDKYFNWGKFAVARFDSVEWGRPVNVPDDLYGGSLLDRCGWDSAHVWVLDLQTGEGVFVRPGGNAAADLNGKHQVWVCPLFQPMLEWLYERVREDHAGWFDKLPAYVELADAPASMVGYRRGQET